VVEPAGNTRVWHLCDFCWSLLEAGFQAHPIDDLVHHYRDPGGSRLRSLDVYGYIREGFLRHLRPDD
jgi:hypothetical protein